MLHTTSDIENTSNIEKVCNSIVSCKNYSDITGKMKGELAAILTSPFQPKPIDGHLPNKEYKELPVSNASDPALITLVKDLYKIINTDNLTEIHKHANGILNYIKLGKAEKLFDKNFDKEGASECKRLMASLGTIEDADNEDINELLKKAKKLADLLAGFPGALNEIIKKINELRALIFKDTSSDTTKKNLLKQLDNQLDQLTTELHSKNKNFEKVKNKFNDIKNTIRALENAKLTDFDFTEATVNLSDSMDVLYEMLPPSFQQSPAKKQEIKSTSIITPAHLTDEIEKNNVDSGRILLAPKLDLEYDRAGLKKNMLKNIETLKGSNVISGQLLNDLEAILENKNPDLKTLNEINNKITAIKLPPITAYSNDPKPKDYGILEAAVNLRNSFAKLINDIKRKENINKLQELNKAHNGKFNEPLLQITELTESVNNKQLDEASNKLKQLQADLSSIDNENTNLSDILKDIYNDFDEAISLLKLRTQKTSFISGNDLDTPAFHDSSSVITDALQNNSLAEVKKTLLDGVLPKNSSTDSIPLVTDIPATFPAPTVVNDTLSTTLNVSSGNSSIVSTGQTVLQPMSETELTNLMHYAYWLAAETTRIINSVNSEKNDIKHLIDRLEKIQEIVQQHNENNKYTILINIINDIMLAQNNFQEYQRKAYFSEIAKIAPTKDSLTSIINELKSGAVLPDNVGGLASSSYFKTTDVNFSIRVTCNTFQSNEHQELKFISVQHCNDTGAKIEFKFDPKDIDALSSRNLMILAIKQVEDFRCLVKPLDNSATSSFDIPIYILPGTHPKLAGAIKEYCEVMQYTSCKHDDKMPIEKFKDDWKKDIKPKDIYLNQGNVISLKNNKTIIEQFEKNYNECIEKNKTQPSQHNLM
jgi:predicted nuclease with TOPRIM domain